MHGRSGFDFVLFEFCRPGRRSETWSCHFHLSPQDHAKHVFKNRCPWTGRSRCRLPGFGRCYRLEIRLPVLELGVTHLHVPTLACSLERARNTYGTAASRQPLLSCGRSSKTLVWAQVLSLWGMHSSCHIFLLVGLQGYWIKRCRIALSQ